jgi:hypothetical protein
MRNKRPSRGSAGSSSVLAETWGNPPHAHEPILLAIRPRMGTGEEGKEKAGKNKKHKVMIFYESSQSQPPLDGLGPSTLLFIIYMFPPSQHS